MVIGGMDSGMLGGFHSVKGRGNVARGRVISSSQSLLRFSFVCKRSDCMFVWKFEGVPLDSGRFVLVLFCLLICVGRAQMRLLSRQGSPSYT